MRVAGGISILPVTIGPKAKAEAAKGEGTAAEVADVQNGQKCELEDWLKSPQ